MVMMDALSFVCVEGGDIDMDIDMDMVGGMGVRKDDEEDNVLLTSVMIELPYERRVFIECLRCGKSCRIERAPHSTTIAECWDTYNAFSTMS